MHTPEISQCINGTLYIMWLLGLLETTKESHRTLDVIFTNGNIELSDSVCRVLDWGSMGC